MKDKVYDNPFYKNILESEEKLLIKQLDNMCEIDYNFQPSLSNRQYLFIRREYGKNT